MPHQDHKIELARRMWAAYSQGPDAFAETVPEGLASSSFITEGEVLHGRDEIHSFLARAAARGVQIQLHDYSFRRLGEDVLGHGSFRFRDPGGLSERQGWWLYRFVGDALVSITGAPLRGGGRGHVARPPPDD